VDETANFEELKPSSFQKYNTSPRSRYATGPSSPTSQRDRRVDRLARRIDVVLAAHIARLESRLREAFSDELAHLRAELRASGKVLATSPCSTSKIIQEDAAQFSIPAAGNSAEVATPCQKQMSEAVGSDSLPVDNEQILGVNSKLSEDERTVCKGASFIGPQGRQVAAKGLTNRTKSWSARSSAVSPVPPLQRIAQKNKAAAKMSAAPGTETHPAEMPEYSNTKRELESSHDSELDPDADLCEVRLELLSHSMSHATDRAEEGAHRNYDR
jgi:hypothetical protein